MDLESRVDVLEKDMKELKETSKETTTNVTSLKESIIELKCSIENNTKSQEKLTTYMEEQKNKPNKILEYVGFTVLGLLLAFILKKLGIA